MRTETRVLSVTFEGSAQNYQDSRFTIPKKVRDILNLEYDSSLHLIIKDENKVVVFDDDCEMKSGPEIYGLRDAVKAGQIITVTVSHARL